MKILLKKQVDKGLFIFCEDEKPFVITTLQQEAKVGDIITNTEYCGHYFETLDEALIQFNKDDHHYQENKTATR